MNQKQMATKIAETLQRSWSSEANAEIVGVVTNMDRPDVSVILANWGDFHLSVTVEILAQP